MRATSRENLRGPVLRGFCALFNARSVSTHHERCQLASAHAIVLTDPRQVTQGVQVGWMSNEQTETRMFTQVEIPTYVHKQRHLCTQAVPAILPLHHSKHARAACAHAPWLRRTLPAGTLRWPATKPCTCTRQEPCVPSAPRATPPTRAHALSPLHPPARRARRRPPVTAAPAPPTMRRRAHAPLWPPAGWARRGRASRARRGGVARHAPQNEAAQQPPPQTQSSPRTC